MTAAARLRALVAEATPGPWTLQHGWDNYTGPEPGEIGGDWVDPHGAYSGNPADNALIALAPQLALLVADMGERIEHHASMAYHEGWERSPDEDDLMEKA